MNFLSEALSLPLPEKSHTPREMKLYNAFIALSLLSLIPFSVGALDVDTKKPKPSATPTPKPKPPPASSCKDELVCCLTLESPSDISAALILGLLHIGLTSEQKKELVGLTCKDIDLTGHPFDNIWYVLVLYFVYLYA